MNANELTVLAAAGVLQLITISLWQAAAAHARWWRGRADRFEHELELYRQWATLRSPKTGRYIKKGH